MVEHEYTPPSTNDESDTDPHERLGAPITYGEYVKVVAGTLAKADEVEADIDVDAIIAELEDDIHD